MKLNKLAQHLEIAFWTIIIGLIDNRRQLRLIPILVVPGMCLSVGMVACACSGLLKASIASDEISSEIATPQIAYSQLETPQIVTSRIETSQLETPLPTRVPKYAANGQRNILVVLVDRMTSDSPHLEGVWLIACLPPTSHATLLPLYPASVGDTPAEDGILSKLFALNENGSPTLDFLNALSDRNIWWDHYLVLDDLALAGVVELIGGVDLGGGEMSGTQVMRFLSQPRSEFQGQLMDQAMLARELCRRIPASLASSDWEIQFELLSGHIYSNMDLSGSKIDWARLRAFATGLSCEFPTLPEIALSQPVH
jgi:hypothetical protein